MPPPPVFVMFICSEIVNRQNQLQHCLGRQRANAWVLSVMLQLSIPSIRVQTVSPCSLLQRSLQQSSDRTIPLNDCGVVPHIALNKYCVPSCYYRWL